MGYKLFPGVGMLQVPCGDQQEPWRNLGCCPNGGAGWGWGGSGVPQNREDGEAGNREGKEVLAHQLNENITGTLFPILIYLIQAKSPPTAICEEMWGFWGVIWGGMAGPAPIPLLQGTQGLIPADGHGPGDTRDRALAFQTLGIGIFSVPHPSSRLWE